MCTTAIDEVFNPQNWFPTENIDENASKFDGVIFTLTEVDVANNVHTASFNLSVEDLENIDTSQFPFPNTLWMVKPASEIALKTGVFVPVVFGGIFLNLVILLTLTKNKWLWNPSNYLIANVAFVDLCTLFFGPWMLLVNDSFQTYSLSIVGCKMEGFAQGTLLLAGVGALMLISYDRVSTVVLPTEARVTKRMATRLVAASWALAGGLSLPLAFYREYRERQWLDYLEIYCVENINVLPIYWHVLIAALVWLPLSAMLFTYGAILWRLERCSQQLSASGAGLCVVRARAKAVWITAAVLVTFIICKVPFTALVYWRNEILKSAQVNAVEGSFQIMWFAAHYLMYFNCAINPLIYGFTNGRYRRAMNKTPFVSFFKFSTWCCVWSCNKKIKFKEKTTVSEKIFVVEATPKPKVKMSNYVKNILNIHRDELNFNHNLRAESLTPKSTKSTPISPVN